MEWQGGNAQLLAMASELHPWRLELEIFPSRLPVDMNAQQGAICEAFFWKCFEKSTSWCFGSHFFLIDSLPFAAVVFWLHLKTKTKFKEKHGKKTPLSTFHCNQLQHTRSACFKTDLPDHLRFNFIQVVTEPRESVVLLWRHGGHVTETRDFQLQTTQMLEASCLFSFKSILLRTSGKCQSIKRTACMLNFSYIAQSKWYLRLKISVQGPFKGKWFISMLFFFSFFLPSLFHYLHEITWCMVVWCTQNLRRDGSSFMWHQPCQRYKYTTSMDI